jgi:DNA-binding response OmpR family regulator
MPEFGSFAILVVEDDPDDVFFVREAFAAAGMAAALSVARDGKEAVECLLGRGAFAQRRLLPSAVLLDLNLPRLSGLEVLEWRQTQPMVKRVPVIVLTSSRSNEDVSRAYDLGANSYLIKPISVEEQREMVKTIRRYWIEMNVAPEPG